MFNLKELLWDGRVGELKRSQTGCWNLTSGGNSTGCWKKDHVDLWIFFFINQVMSLLSHNDNLTKKWNSRPITIKLALIANCEICHWVKFLFLFFSLLFRWRKSLEKKVVWLCVIYFFLCNFNALFFVVEKITAKLNEDAAIKWQLTSQNSLIWFQHAVH